MKIELRNRELDALKALYRYHEGKRVRMQQLRDIYVQKASNGGWHIDRLKAKDYERKLHLHERAVAALKPVIEEKQS